jgi:hypothetical protein
MQYRRVREGKKTECKMMSQNTTTDQIAINIQSSSTKESLMKRINTTHIDNYGDDNYNDAHYDEADKTTAMQPGKYDVLFGRGKKVKVHFGNIMCDQLIELSYKKYESANKVIKTEISEQIITAIQESGGRFLKKTSSAGQHNNSGNNSDGDYYYYEEVERNIAREKIAHSFRRLRKKPVSTMALFASRTFTTSNTSSRTSSFSSNNSNGSMEPVLLQRQQHTELMPNRLDRVFLSASMNNSSNYNRKNHMLLKRQSELMRKLNQVSLSASNNTNESCFNDNDNSSRNTCFGNVFVNDGRGGSSNSGNITTVTNKNSYDPFDMYIQLRKKQKEEYQRLQQHQHNHTQHQETGTGMGKDTTPTITSMSRTHISGSMPNIGSLSELASGCGDIDMILSGGIDHGHYTAMINGMHNESSWANPNPDSFLEEDVFEPLNDKNDDATTTISSCPVEQFISSFGF